MRWTLQFVLFQLSRTAHLTQKLSRAILKQSGATIQCMAQRFVLFNILAMGPKDTMALYQANDEKDGSSPCPYG